MKLGVKYISLWKDGSLFTTNCGNAVICDKPNDNDPWLVVDLDSLPSADATEAEQHESQFVYHWGALQAVRHDANPDDAVARELVRLRGECERMREVVEMATVAVVACKDDESRAMGELVGAIERYLSYAQPQPRAGTPADGAQLDALKRGRDWLQRTTFSENIAPGFVRALDAVINRQRDAPPTLTAQEREALIGLLKAHEANKVYTYLEPGSVTRERVVSAINKLLGAP